MEIIIGPIIIKGFSHNNHNIGVFFLEKYKAMRLPIKKMGSEMIREIESEKYLGDTGGGGGGQ